MKELFKVKRKFIIDPIDFDYWTADIPKGIKWGQADNSLEKEGYVIVWADVTDKQKKEILNNKSHKHIATINTEITQKKDFVNEYRIKTLNYLKNGNLSN